MAGQFTDTGSRYALEALTGRQALSLAANQFTISGTPAANTGIASNNTTGQNVSTYKNGTTLVTLTAAPTGIYPNMYVFIGGNATAAFNGYYQVTGVSWTQNQVEISTATAAGAGGTLYFLPQAKTTYIALCTAQPLDNNFITPSGAPGTLQIQEYAASGYTRQSVTWAAVTEPNQGSATIFVGTGGTINGTATTGPVYTVAPSSAITVTNIVVNGSTANPPYTATVTYTSNQAVAVGQNITIGGSWTGGTGTITAGTYTITSVPSYGTFVFGTNQTAITGNATSATASGTFTGGTITVPGPLNATFTTYNTTAGTGTPTAVAHGLVVGSTVNLRGTTVSAGVMDVNNATIVAVPGTTGQTQFTIQVENSATGANTTNTTIAAASVFPGAYFTSGATSVTATGFVTYVGSNSFVAGDTVVISGLTGVTGYNGTKQVFAASASSFVVLDTTTGAPTGSASIARVGAISVGGLIQNSNTLTFGAFTANTGATVTHAALVSSPSAAAGTSIATGATIASATPASGYARITTAASHSLLTGHQVYISGLVPAGYNGLYTVLAVTAANSFDIANSTTGSVTTAGTVSGGFNGEVLAWWALDTPRTPAVNDQVVVNANQLSLYVN